MSYKNQQNIERRYVTLPVTMEKRAEDDNQPAVVSGYAAKFNQRTKIGNYFYEEILPGFFDDVLNDDVRCLKNHAPSLLLARSKNGEGTLKLEVDQVGLRYTFAIPNRTVGRDLEDELKTGDLSQSSFSFDTKEDVWIDNGDDLPIRQLKKAKQLYDVSPVTFPAYQDTSIGKRALDMHIEAIEVVDAQQIEKNKRALELFEAQHNYNKNNS